MNKNPNEKTNFVKPTVSLEILDKLEAPPIPDSYGISMAHAILLDITRSIGAVIQRTPDMVRILFLIFMSICKTL